MTRRIFVPTNQPEKGRHLAFEHRVEGKYTFSTYEGGSGATEKLQAYNEMTAELQALIAEAVNLGKEIRAQGSSWSLSKAGMAADRLVNTKPLRLLRFTLPRSVVSDSYPGDYTKLRFVECGESIMVLNQMLFAEKLSLKASGSNNGQTLAGALSTGTHGSAFNFGAIPEFVVGLHLIVGPSKHVYLQRASSPVMRKSFADKLGAQFIQDDELFNAALVSFGSFGIIQGIMIETRDLFILHSTRFPHAFNQGLKDAISSLDFSGLNFSGSTMPGSVPRNKPYHFQVYFNPNEGVPARNATVLMMFEDKWGGPYTPPPRQDDEAGPSASGLEVIGMLYDHLPWPLTQLLLPMHNAQIAKQLGPQYAKGIIRDLFADERVTGKLMVSGTAFPRARALEAQDIALRTYQQFGTLLPVIISSRFVKGTQALLGFTKFQDTCTMEIDSINTPEAVRYLNLVRTRLEQAGIPFTCHWGKLDQHMTPARLRSVYGPDLDRWKNSRAALLENAAVARVFTNEFMTRLGLA